MKYYHTHTIDYNLSSVRNLIVWHEHESRQSDKLDTEVITVSVIWLSGEV